MHELLSVVAHELRALGSESPVGEVTLSEGPLPHGGDDDVYVVIPHEFFVVLPQEDAPDPGQLERTIGFCVEHPGNETFQTTVRWARKLAACVDINDDSTMELNELGITAERFVLGYSTCWDRWGGVTHDRPHDVIYLGTADERRSRLLSLDVGPLERADLLLAMPPHEPMVKPRPDFFMGDAKLKLLASSKVLLNIHRGESRSLEWVRVLEAMCNGCVVVSEHSADISPLRPGEHLLLGRPRTLVHLARSVVTDETRLRSLRTECYEFLRSNLDMRSSALALAQLADDVRVGALGRKARSRRRATRVPWPPDPAGRVFSDDAPGESEPVPRAMPPLARTPPFPVRVPPVARDEGDVDVVVLRSPGSPDAAVALGPVLRQVGAGSVHVCLNGVSPGALPEDRRIVVHHYPTQTGTGRLLNEVLVMDGSSLLLVLDAGDQLVPRALEHLRRELRSRGCDAAYGMVVTPLGLLSSALPFEPRRLTTSNYLAAAALWRRAALSRLGGWSEDPAIDGFEAWDLWRRLAASGGTACLVPRPLVYQAFAQRTSDVPDERFPDRVARSLDAGVAAHSSA